MAQRLIQSINDELRGVAGARCKSRADNAVRTSRALDKALEGYYGGREGEFWARAAHKPSGLPRTSYMMYDAEEAMAKGAWGPGIDYL